MYVQSLILYFFRLSVKNHFFPSFSSDVVVESNPNRFNSISNIDPNNLKNGPERFEKLVGQGELSEKWLSKSLLFDVSGLSQVKVCCILFT